MFTQVSGSGPLGPLVSVSEKKRGKKPQYNMTERTGGEKRKEVEKKGEYK